MTLMCSVARGQFSVCFGAVGIRFTSAAPALIESVRARYEGFLFDGAVDCEIELVQDPTTAVVDPASAYELQVERCGDLLKFRWPPVVGTVDLRARRGTLSVFSHPRFGAGVYVENALRHICQSLAIERGSFYLHAAGIEPPWGSTAQVFCGVSGSGKSTISALLGRAGGQILSDDLVCIETGSGSPILAATPFFGELRDAVPATQRWLPIQSLDFLEQTDLPRRQPMTHPAAAAAMTLTNVPFAECLPTVAREQLLESVACLIAGVDTGVLGFRPDDSFLPLIGWKGTNT